MTVLDEVEALQARIVARVEELEPLVREYNELKQVAERMGVELGNRRAATARARPRPRRAKPRARHSAPGDGARSGGTRAVGAERRERMLALVRERPGITVPELSDMLGVAPPPVYRVVRKLTAEGVVQKEGRGLRLTSP